MTLSTPRRRRRKLYDSNPWGLSPAVERALDAVCQAGSNKGAARLLGLEHVTVSDNMKSAKRAIGAKGTRLQTLLVWDRWRQRQKVGAA